MPQKLTSSLPVHESFNSCAKNAAIYAICANNVANHQFDAFISYNGSFHMAKHEFLLQMWEIDDLSTDNVVSGQISTFVPFLWLMHISQKGE